MIIVEGLKVRFTTGTLAALIEKRIRDAFATAAHRGEITVARFALGIDRYEAAGAQQTLRQAMKRTERSKAGWRTRDKKAAEARKAVVYGYGAEGGAA